MSDQTHTAVIIFYSKASGVQAPLAFSEEFKHVNAVVHDGTDWIMLDLDKNGLLTRRIRCPNVETLTRSLHSIKDITAIFTLNIPARHTFNWWPWWTRSCNEVVRYTVGLDIGWSFNPYHLYKKLIKYDQIKNYTIIDAWRRQDGWTIRRG